MIMKYEYLDELKEHIKDTPDVAFQNNGMSKDAVLSDKDTMERLWAEYQKDVEEYEMSPTDAYIDALHCILNIELVDDSDSEDEAPAINPDAWFILFTDRDGRNGFFTAAHPEQVPIAVEQARAVCDSDNSILIANLGAVITFTPTEFAEKWL